MAAAIRKSNTTKPKGDDVMASLLKDVTEKFQLMLSEKFEEQNKHFTSMLGRIVDLEENMADTNNHIKSVEEKVQQIGNTQYAMGNDVDWMYKKIQTAEKLQRSKTVVVTGVDYIKEENLIEILTKISNVLNVAVNETDIDELYRINSVDKKSRFIVKFTRTLLKQKIIEGIRMKKSLYTNEVGLEGESQIYLNEYLSQKNNEFWREAKKLRSTNKVKFAWIRDGEVYLRQKEGGERIHVNNFNILHQFQGQFNDQKKNEN